MKNIFSISVLVLMMIVTSCKKDDNSNSTPSIGSTVQQGKWKVTSYIDSGNDETNHYTNYEFQFNSDGTVAAIKTGSTINGTWSNGNDDSQQKLYLSFSTSPFDELNDDWHITSQSSSQIKLEDVSGGNGGTDYLTFEKI
ncbi:MAG: hypothetical protein ABI723_01860 [Bacteroidia bacterium]